MKLIKNIKIEKINKGEIKMGVETLGIILLLSSFFTVIIMTIDMLIQLDRKLYSYIYKSFVIFSLLCIVIDNYGKFGINIPNISFTISLIPIFVLILLLVIFIYIKIIPDIVDEFKNSIIEWIFCVLTNILLFIMLFQYFTI